MRLEVTKEWKDAFPGASVGLLVMKNTVNPKNNPDLDNKMKEIEEDIRNNFSQSGEKEFVNYLLYERILNIIRNSRKLTM